MKQKYIVFIIFTYSQNRKPTPGYIYYPITIRNMNQPMKADISKKLLDDQASFSRKSTFAVEDNNPISRRSTFSRAFTLDGAAIQRTITQPFEGLSRTLTEVHHRFDPDAQFTNAIIQNYTKHAESGLDGDVPLPPGFARKPAFYKMLFLIGISSSIIAIICLAFMNIIDKAKISFYFFSLFFFFFFFLALITEGVLSQQVPKTWATCDYDNDSSCGDFYTGEKWWILMTGGCGFLIGFIRWFFEFPDDLAGIFKEILNYHVDWKWSPLTFIISAISLASGASLGPEAAMVTAL
jgi:hypothetical protein